MRVKIKCRCGCGEWFEVIPAIASTRKYKNREHMVNATEYSLQNRERAKKSPFHHLKTDGIIESKNIIELIESVRTHFREYGMWKPCQDCEFALRRECEPQYSPPPAWKAKIICRKHPEFIIEEMKLITCQR